MNLVRAYFYSHLYMVLTFIAGTVSMLLMMWVKRKIKQSNIVKYRRIIIPIIASVIAAILFKIETRYWGWGVVAIKWYFMAGAFAVGEYEIIKRVLGSKQSILVVASVFIICLGIEGICCTIIPIEPHFKTCHAIMGGFAVFGLWGLVESTLKRTEDEQTRREED